MKFEKHNKPYLLFDAGGTIVFPNQRFLIQLAQRQGLELTHEQLFDGYYRVMHKLDCDQAHCDKGFNPSPWPEVYINLLSDELKMNSSTAEEIVKTFSARHRERNLWAFTFDWVRETLGLLKNKGYGMSVISNSDHRTKTVIHDIGLDSYFDRVFASEILGVEKPDPRIFEIVLCELELEPNETLYVGDVFYVDVRGANQAGIGGIHLDPLHLFKGWPGVHLERVSDLPNWLDQYIADPAQFEPDLFPFGKVSELSVSSDIFEKLQKT